MARIVLAIFLTGFLSTSVVSCSFFKKSKKVDAEKALEDSAEDLSEFGEDESMDPLGGDSGDSEEFAEDEDFLSDDTEEATSTANIEEKVEDEDFFEEGGDPLDSATDDELLGDTDSSSNGDVVATGQSEFGEDTTNLTNNEPIQEIEENPTISPDSFASESTNVDVVNDLSETSDFGSETSDQFSEPVVAEKKWVPVKKMKSAPFTKGRVLANTLYVARAGDTLKKISQKIYGQNKVKELMKVNPTLYKGIKVGTKVYYNSPNRPDDNSSMLSYFEDIGANPQIYVTQPGDNIRTLSKQLLGSSGSWKEVYATNPFIESKGALEGGVEIRFWPEDSSGMGQQTASNNFDPQPIEAPVEENFPEPEPFEQAPPPVQVAKVKKTVPKPIAPQKNQAVRKEDSIPPPPTVAAATKKALPAPPKIDLNKNKPKKIARKGLKKKKKKVNKKLASAKRKKEQDSIMMLGAAGIGIIALLTLFIIWRKKRSRNEIDFNTSATHIE